MILKLLKQIQQAIIKRISKLPSTTVVEFYGNESNPLWLKFNLFKNTRPRFLKGPWNRCGLKESEDVSENSSLSLVSSVAYHDNIEQLLLHHAHSSYCQQ